VYENDGGCDGLCWVSFENLRDVVGVVVGVVVARARRRRRALVLWTLDKTTKLSVFHNLCPMYDGFYGRGAVEVRVRGEFLGGGDVGVCECEEVVDCGVYEEVEDGGWEETLEF